MRRDSKLSSVLHLLLHMAHSDRPLTSDELAGFLHTNPVLVRRTLAGLRGDGWNLGFVVETERQVEAHLDEHLVDLPAGDLRSRAVIRVMKEDEARHAEHAEQAGARRLPFPIPGAMALASRVMKTIAYRL